MVEHRKTKLGLLAQIYGDQVKNSRKRFMKAPAYTLKEFQAFAILDYSFNYLYSTWKDSGYTSFEPAFFDLLEVGHWFARR